MYLPAREELRPSTYEVFFQTSDLALGIDLNFCPIGMHVPLKAARFGVNIPKCKNDRFLIIIPDSDLIHCSSHESHKFPRYLYHSNCSNDLQY